MKTYLLKDLVEIQQGFAFKSKDYVSESNTSSFRMSNIRPGGVVDLNHNLKFLPDIFKDQYKDFLLKEGDLVMAMTDMAQNPKILGIPSIITRLDKNYLLNQRVARFKYINKDVVDQKYLYYYFLAPQVRKYLISEGSGGLQINLSSKSIYNLQVPVPSLQEQEKIVDRLDKVFKNSFDYIFNISSELIELERLEESYIKNIFDKEKSNSFKLGNFFDITSSKRVFKSEWKDEGVPFLRARELVRLAKNMEFKDPIFISNSHYEQIKNKYGVPKAGDILITGVGTLGITYLVDSSKKFYFKDGNIIWLKNLNKVNPNYIKSYIDSPNFQDKINKKIGATVKTFTISDAKNTEVPIPSEEKQKIIYEKIQEFKNIKNDLKKTYEQNIKKLNLLKKSVLNQKFSYE